MMRKIICLAATKLYVLTHLGVWLYLRRRFPAVLRIPTDMALNEKLLVYELAADVADGGVIAEIGSYVGASAAVMASAVKGRGVSVHCVDTWQNDAMSEGRRDTYSEFLFHTAPFRDEIEARRGLSEETAAAFESQVDLLFVDGDHSYEGCRRDLLCWLPKVKPGGTVVCHDLAWAGGVRQAMEEVLLPCAAGPLHRLWNIGWVRVGSREAPHEQS